MLFVFDGLDHEGKSVKIMNYIETVISALNNNSFFYGTYLDMELKNMESGYVERKGADVLIGELEKSEELPLKTVREK